MNDFERFYIGENPIYFLQQCKDSFEDLGLTRVSSSNRYNENLNPPMTEKTVKKPGEDGQYYFSTDLGATNHSINVAFDNLSEEQLRQLKQIQSSKSFWRLTYDNVPYKYYNVKPTGTSKLSYVPFLEDGKRKYKGEGTLEFICYEGCAHCWVDSKSEFYTDDAMTTPKKRFENIDEWKDSCGLFEETKKGFIEIQKNFEKAISTEKNTLTYTANSGTVENFFVDGVEKIIKIKQVRQGSSDEGKNLKSTLTFFQEETEKETIKKDWVPDEITLDFSQDKVVGIFEGDIVQKEIFENFANGDSFNKIEWKIYGPYLAKQFQTSSEFKPWGANTHDFVGLDYTYSDFLAGHYDLSLEANISLGVTQDFELAILYTINNKQPYMSFYSTKIKQQGGASIQTNFSIYSTEDISTISLYFIFNKGLMLYKGVGTVSASIRLNQIDDKRTMVLKYPGSTEGNNITFTKDSDNKFYYTCYSNYGDKDTHPIITFENTSSAIKKVGLYLSSGLTSDLQITEEQYNLLFDVSVGTYVIDNEKCLLTRNKDFENGKIIWGDFFTISEKESCFIYLVCFDENGDVVNLSISDLASAPKIQMNYLYY